MQWEQVSALVFLVTFLLLLRFTYITIPLLTFKVDSAEITGRVVAINNKYGRGLIEIWVETPPYSTTCERCSPNPDDLAYFYVRKRLVTRLPSVKQIIKAKTTRISYPLRGETISWLGSFEEVPFRKKPIDWSKSSVKRGLDHDDCCNSC